MLNDTQYLSINCIIYIFGFGFVIFDCRFAFRGTFKVTVLVRNLYVFLLDNNLFYLHLRQIFIKQSSLQFHGMNIKTYMLINHFCVRKPGNNSDSHAFNIYWYIA